MPSYQGNAIQDATLVLKIGGKQVTEHLMNLLMNGKYSFPDDNFLLWRKKNKTKFTVSSRKEIIREMKVITIDERAINKLFRIKLKQTLLEHIPFFNLLSP